MPSRPKVTILPQALNDFAFTKVILQSPHGTITHKTLHSDLRELEFVSTQPFVCYLIKGRERFSQPDGDQTILHEGDLIAIPKDLHVESDFVSNNGPLEAILIFYSDEFLQSRARRRPPAPTSSPKIGRIPADPKLTAFMQNMVSIYQNLSVDNDLVQAKLTELLSLLETLCDEFSVVTALQACAKPPTRSLRDIMQNYGVHDLSSTELAALSGRSVPSFNRDFRRTFGTSPAKWRIQQRLSKALALLERSDQSVTEIALGLGYESPSYFSEQFRGSFGKTPSQYRKDCRTLD